MRMCLDCHNPSDEYLRCLECEFLQGEILKARQNVLTLAESAWRNRSNPEMLPRCLDSMLEETGRWMASQAKADERTGARHVARSKRQTSGRDEASR